MPMSALFKQFGYDFDFINIDVEGTNAEMFRALPRAALKQAKLICVEHDGCQHQMSQLAAANGFHALHRNGENLIFTRKTPFHWFKNGGVRSLGKMLRMQFLKKFNFSIIF